MDNQQMRTMAAAMLLQGQDVTDRNMKRALMVVDQLFAWAEPGEMYKLREEAQEIPGMGNLTGRVFFEAPIHTEIVRD
jgi:hypothetical protein